MTVGELPPHQFEIITALTGGNFTSTHKWSASIASVPNNTVADIGSGFVTAGTNIMGSGVHHNNVAPCVSAYLWQRTV